jgi:hypothetical protein
MGETADDLREIRAFLARLESGQLQLRRSGKDVTQEEIAILKQEVAFLEKIIARPKKTLRGYLARFFGNGVFCDK